MIVLVFDMVITVRGVLVLSFQQVVGLSTNIAFLTSLCEHSHFKNGDVHTDFIKVLHLSCIPIYYVCYITNHGICNVFLSGFIGYQ